MLNSMTAGVRTCRDGTKVLVRPIRPDDRGRVEAAFDRMSPESRYRRFFRPISSLSESELDYLTDVDHSDHEALVALDATSDRLVGVARYVRTGPDVAEPAVAVADDWQGQGVATLLLEELVARALAEGVERFSAVVLASNPAAIRLVEQAGDATIDRQGSVVEIDVALRPPDGAVQPASPLRSLLRAAAAGTLDPALSIWQRLMRPSQGTGEKPRSNLIVAAVGPDRNWSAAAEIARAARASLVLVASMTAGDDEGSLQQRLQRLAAVIDSPDANVELVAAVGDLTEATLAVARERLARLIVLEHAAAAGDTARPGGILWHQISDKAPCSVIVCR
jgi:RimJ/RimL family protein N-acetyltransferase